MKPPGSVTQALAFSGVIVSSVLLQALGLSTTGFTYWSGDLGAEFLVLTLLVVLIAPAWAPFIIGLVLTLRSKARKIQIAIWIAGVIAALAAIAFSLDPGTHDLGRSTDVRWNTMAWLLITYVLVLPISVAAGVAGIASLFSNKTPPAPDA